MSYDFYLKDPVTHETLRAKVKHHIFGGTYALGGTDELWLNITFNYADIFCKYLDKDKGVKAIIGMTGAESIPVLEKAINAMGDDVDPDYWKATEGNAKRALQGLVAIARMRPDGVWDCCY